MYLRGRCASRPDRSQLRAPRSEKRWYRPREVTWRLIVGCTASKQQCFSGAEDVGVLATLTNDDVARRCADDLDAEAAYYRHRAVQEEQALGAGYYVDCSEAWRPTGPCWRSGYGPENQCPQRSAR